MTLGAESTANWFKFCVETNLRYMKIELSENEISVRLCFESTRIKKKKNFTLQTHAIKSEILNKKKK